MLIWEPQVVMGQAHSFISDSLEFMRCHCQILSLFEHLQGTTFIESERDVNAYRVAFGALRDNSLNPQASPVGRANIAGDGISPSRARRRGAPRASCLSRP